MTAVIKTENLTKSYGTHRGIVDMGRHPLGAYKDLGMRVFRHIYFSFDK